MKHLISTLILLFAITSISFAQPDNTKKVVQLTNGNEYTGTIISDDGREMLFESTSVGKIYIKKTDIKSISNFKEDDFVILNDQKVKSNPFSTRYSFTTNALPIKKRENYYMINLWGPEFHIAVADNFNVGIMTSWIGSPFALAAKYSFQTKNPKLNFSIGEIAGNGGYIDPQSLISLSFGNVTYGDRDRNFTLGVGYGVFDFNQEMYRPGTYYPTVGNPYPSIQYIKRPATKGFIGSVGMNLRLSEKTSFIFDSMFGSMNTVNSVGNWFFDPSSQSSTAVILETRESKPFFIFMPGLRINQGDGKAFQVCVAGANIQGQTIPMPYVTWFRKL